MSKDAKFYYPHYERSVFAYTIPAGELSSNSEILSSNYLPSKVVVGFVKSKAFYGEPSLSPFNFQSFDISECDLTVDGESVFGRATTFEDDQMLTGYKQMYPDDKNQVTYSPDKFASSAFLMAFDLKPTDNNNFYQSRQGVLRFNVTFKNPLPENITAVIYIKKQAMLMLDKHGNPTVTHF